MRLLTALLAVTVLGITAAAAQSPRPLAQALSAMRGDRWDQAAALAVRDGPGAAGVIQWHRLRAGEGTAEEVTAFLAAHPDWPGLKLLRARSEEAMEGAPRGDILEFFAAEPAQTAVGALIHAGALEADGQVNEAQAVLRRAWTTMPMDDETHAIYLAMHAAVVGPHHGARLERMLWFEGADDARQMLALVPGVPRALAEARLAIRESRDAAELIEALPEDMRAHPGLDFERFRRLTALGRVTEAAELLDRLGAALPYPQLWANQRRSIARQQMRSGSPALAYRLAASHGLDSGNDYADLEWLAGYIALRKHDNPARALDHFTRFLDAVDSPISVGRACYWIGRAYEAMGDAERAHLAYSKAAHEHTSFYGILAAGRAGLPLPADLDGAEEFPPWRQASFTASEVFQTGVLLLASDELYLAERFFVHLAESLSRQELGQLGDAVTEMGAPHLAVMLGKQGARQGMIIPKHYFALHPMVRMDLPIAPELGLAIARRESEFDPGVVSPAGARGLMQLMPRTAEAMAGETGRPYEAARLTGDWAYNAALGSAYLAKVLQEFGGNMVLAAAAYNAGPSRPARWIELFGDPRDPAVDVIDWIEHIPFRETRNYVMRVTESAAVYRMRLGLGHWDRPFEEMLAASGGAALPAEGE